MTDQIYFDNFLIVEDEATAQEFARATWLLKKQIELTKSASSSDSVIDGLLKAANDKPWLWAIYLLVILLPVVLIAIFCFGGSKTKPAAAATSSGVDLGQAKKTDAPTADVVEEEDGQGGEVNNGNGQIDDDEDDDDDNDDSAEKVEKEDLEEMDEPEKVD